MIETLQFRRPTAGDLDAVFRLHGDPKTNVYNPAGPDDRDASQGRLTEWLDHWDEHGFGYELVEDETGLVYGVAGVRRSEWLGVPILNLYYRFGPEFWGKGLATAAGRRALGVAGRVAPGVPVIARTKPDNLASQRTAAKLGLQRRPELEVDDETGAVRIFATIWPTNRRSSLALVPLWTSRNVVLTFHLNQREHPTRVDFPSASRIARALGRSTRPRSPR